jgi:hypothetical protein
MGTEDSFPGGKAAGADHSPPASAKVKKMRNYIYTPPIHLNGVVLNYLSTGTTLLLPFTGSGVPGVTNSTFCLKSIFIGLTGSQNK